jgi:hypothetical protein
LQSLTVIDFPTVEFSPETEHAMANAAELTAALGKLEERVKNHIAWFKGAIAGGFAWLAVLSLLLYNIHTDVKNVAIAQADAPAKFAAQLLSQPQTSGASLASNLKAVSTILQTSKQGKVKPDVSALNVVSAKLSEIQDKEPTLPSVWEATGTFINYKSDAVVPNSSTITNANGVRCQGSLGSNGFVFSNCEINLERLAENIQNVQVDGEAATFTFIRCVVRYSGGAIPAKHLLFIDSVFRFDILVVPAPEGVLAMRQLTIAPFDREINLSIG